MTVSAPSPAAKPSQRVRGELRAVTSDAHERLHQHPLLSRLVAPGLRQQDYVGATSVTFWALSALEAKRDAVNVWPRLGLAAAISALASDLANSPSSPPNARLTGLHTPHHVLGALYVAHGASFGAQVISRSVQTNLPQAPRSYYDLKPGPAWHEVKRALSNLTPQQEDATQDGALRMFAFYEALADEAQAHIALMSESGFFFSSPRA